MPSKKAYYADIEKSRAEGRMRAALWRKLNPEKKKRGARDYYAKNRERIIAKSRQWEIDNAEKKRARNRVARLRDRYSLTPEQFERMLVVQGHKCAICAEPLDADNTHVDHNHETGRVRALLCAPCNIALGALERRGGHWVGMAQMYRSQFKHASVLELGLWRGDWSQEPAE